MACLFYSLLFLIFHTHLPRSSCSQGETSLLTLTVATERTDGFHRFQRSAEIYGHNLNVLGQDQFWKGGDVANGPGGGFKINLLVNELKKYKDLRDQVILFVDSYDVILLAPPDEILKRFSEFNARVVFSAEGTCWPDSSLANEYPKTDKGGKRYLCSGGFIGYAPELYEMVTSSPVADTDDDQLFFSKIYVNQTLREKSSMKLDHKSKIFQNLYGAIGDVELRFDEEGDAHVRNTAFSTEPLIVHGNGLSKNTLNSLGNYLAKSWSSKEGCLACAEDTISLQKMKPDTAPQVLIGIFVEHATPFLEEFFTNIVNLRYPKERISLILHNAVSYHNDHIEHFLSSYKEKYSQVKVIPSSSAEFQARNMALEECVKINCDYYFSISSDARITNDKTLIKLIEQNRKVIAPLLVRPNQLWSSFWGALSSDGYYARSHDYVDIVKQKRRGVWNVPHISEAYLIHGSVLKKGLSTLNAVEGEARGSNYPSFSLSENLSIDSDMSFCMSLRSNGIFMYVTNTEDFGHLTNSDTYVTHHKQNDLYEIYTNQLDWEKRYIHENYSETLKHDVTLEQPCPDVYWFPVVSPTFCKHLVEEMENYGKWSAGKNQDPRIKGGYENVPTRDIHMNQVGLEQQWLFFLREYIRPMQEKIFIGYSHDPPQAHMNFVVRYHPEEQSFLRPHHDSSTYTINIALNRPHLDYEGGGCRFIRYNCSVVDLRLGWSLIHPGRLTHYHEGLLVTKGTRYIMVSFVDP